MAMGYPAVGCESLYRNTLSSVRRFFKTYHKNLIKVYNLCLESEKIYSKDRFPDIEVALFPFSDHQICPVR
jgi:phosphatidylinositol-3,4,5-trisphosphate 3-phosphatase and dual-specificity protein phosphatase PTEN